MLKFGYIYIEKMKMKVVIYIICSIIVSALNIITPLLIGKIIDTITFNKSVKILLYICLCFFCIKIGITILQYYNYKLYIILQTNAAFQINKDIIKHLHMISLQELDNFDMVYLNDRINTDSNAVITFFLNLITQLINNILVFATSAIILFRLNKPVFIISMVLCLLYLLLYFKLKKIVFSLSMLFKENQASFFAILLEQLKNIAFIKRHALSKIFLNKLEISFKCFFDKVIKTQKFTYFYNSIESIISSIAQVGIFFFAGVAVINGKISIGSFTIAFSYFKYILSTTSYFSGLGKSYQDTYASYKRILELLNFKEQSDGQKMVNDIRTISCENLSFSRGNKDIITNFTCVFNKGNIYCITGDNGAGKSTLIDIILGVFPDEYQGQLLYNGYDIRTLCMEKIRLFKISVMEQVPYFFKGSVDENIYLTNLHTSNMCQDFFKCTHNKDCEDFIFMKDSNNDSTLLSGGEEQKVAFLRMISKDADVMILDEPTASVDTKSKKMIFNYIEKLAENKIILLVTHDNDIISLCRNIIRL